MKHVRCLECGQLIKDAPRMGEQWTDDEESDLLTNWADGYSVREIANAHGRSLLAITMRLELLGCDVPDELDPDEHRAPAHVPGPL